MKKIISVVLALALAMSMTVIAFAVDIPSNYGTEKTVDTSSSDWIEAYSADTSWQGAWTEYLKQEAQTVYTSSDQATALNDLKTKLVSEIEKGNVSKATMTGAITDLVNWVNEQTWAEKVKGQTYKAAASQLQEAVDAATEPTSPEPTTQPSGGGDEPTSSSGGGGGSSSSTYTAEEYGKKIVDMLAGGLSATDVASTIVSDLMSGAISADQIPDIIAYVSENTDTSDSDASGVLDFLEGLGDQIGGGESIIPGGGDGDISLPDLGSLGDLFSGFDLSSIGSLISGIPVIGPIIAGLLGIDDGSGDNGGNGGGNNGSDNTWDNGGTDDFSNNDTGDISFIAVGTVALVAGAALILTRKKNEEEE